MLKRQIRGAGLLLLGFMLTSFGVNAAPFNPSLKWFTIKTPHFAIHFHEGEKAVAQKAAGYLEEAYAEHGRRFGIYPWERIQVSITDNFDSANGFATVLPYNEINLRVVPPSPNNPLGDYDDWLRLLIMHEYTHIIHFNDVGYPMKIFRYLFGRLMAPNGMTPSWVSEGMATWMETEMTQSGRGRSSFAEMMLRTDILNKQFLTLDQMYGAQYDWPGYLGGYIYGVKFWQYLTQTYGEETMVQFSHKYGASPLFYMMNRQAKKVYGKTFRQLWQDWKASLEEKYAQEMKDLKKGGLREGVPVVMGQDSYLRPSLSPDGKQLFYEEFSTHRSGRVRSLNLETGEEKTRLKSAIASVVKVSPKGDKILYSKVTPNDRLVTSYQELSTTGLEDKKTKILTSGERARDPDYSPDAKTIVFVKQETAKASLALFDLETEKVKILVAGNEWDDFNMPRFSPDGQKVAVSVWREGRRDMAVVEVKTGRLYWITRDTAMDSYPAWSPQGDLYFSSDRSGISNIYRYSFKTKQFEKITHVVSGAFAPSVGADGTVYFQYYNGRGYEIRKVKGRYEGEIVDAQSAPPLPSPPPKGGGDSTWKDKPYSPFSAALLPHYIQPDLLFLDNAIFASVLLGSNDPLGWHYWNGAVSYRTDAPYTGFSGSYAYTRWRPTYTLSGSRYVVNYGNIFGTGSDYFEERSVGMGGVSRSLWGQSLSLSYLFENRDNYSAIPAGALVLPTRGHYAGLLFRYARSSQESFPASISVEKGYKLNWNFQITDEQLGSDATLEQQLFWGDGRVYVPLPWQHHVLAFRSAGGIAWGDSFYQGNFGLGGSLGEGLLTGTSSRVFTLRGLPLNSFSRDRALLFSSEYRIPLFGVQRGLGTLPFYMQKAHMGIFADYGDAWNATEKTQAEDFFDNFLLGVGAELRGDFVALYHVPLTGRLGYGLIVLNNDRVSVLADPYTGKSIKYGILILEIGTSF